MSAGHERGIRAKFRTFVHLTVPEDDPSPSEAKDSLKPKGYNKLAYLFGKYPEAVILRRFGHLNAINLLRLQAKLMSLNRQFEANWFDDDTSNDSDVECFSVAFEKLEAATSSRDSRPQRARDGSGNSRQDDRREVSLDSIRDGSPDSRREDSGEGSRDHRRQPRRNSRREASPDSIRDNSPDDSGGNSQDHRRRPRRHNRRYCRRDYSPDSRRIRRLANLDEIRDTLKEYYEAMKLGADVAQLPQPDNPRIRFLQKWLIGVYEGQGFLQQKEAATYHEDFQDDFVALLPSTSWINPQVWDFLHWLAPPKESGSTKINPEEPLPEKSDAKKEFDVELGRVEDFDSTRAVRTSKLMWQIIVVLVASMMCIIAVLILYYLKETVRRIGFAIGSTAFVGLFMFIFTAASEKEVFGMTAAYAAIVVVFIGSANGN